MLVCSDIKMTRHRPYHAWPQNRKLQTIALTAAILLGTTMPAMAQCARVETEIIPLRAVAPVKAVPWSRTMGLQGMDRFLTAVAGPKGTLMLWGESQPYNLETQKPGQRTLYRVVLDAKGKVQSETRIKIPEAGQLQSITTVGVLYYALDKAPNSTFVLRGFDGDGRLQKGLPLDGIVTSIVSDGPSHALVLGQAKDGTARMQRITLPSGKADWTRLFMPGTTGRLETAIKMPDGTWAVGGQVQDQGWFMAVTKTGAIMAQRMYPRGEKANITQVGRLPDGDVLLAGTITGAGTKNSTAMWLMRVAPNGDMHWQRHITGMYALDPVSIQSLADGRMAVIANATPTDPSVLGREQVRRLIFNDRGELIDHQSFQDGVITRAEMTVAAKDASKPALAIGASQTGFVEPDSPPDLLAAALDAWVVALPPLADYTDPCLKR